MKIKVKIPTCKCMESQSDFRVERGYLDTKTQLWGYDYTAGCRINQLENNFCPQCGKKYEDAER